MTKPRIPSYRPHKGLRAGPGRPQRHVRLPRQVGHGGEPVPVRAGHRRVAGQRPPPALGPGLSAGSPAPADPDALRVSELIVAFEHAKKHYRHPDGTPTGELDNYRDALRPLRRLFGDTLAREFGPLRLRAVRDDMVKAALCRSTINARVHRIRRAFRWAASMELIPASVVEALNTVASLQRGRCDARESNGVQPVNWKLVDNTLPHLPGAVAAMVEIMRYSNYRAEDVVMMRPCDLSPSPHQMSGEGVPDATALRELLLGQA
jgi:hypothetical protein